MSEVKFTDDDVKRLKEEINNCECGDDLHCIHPSRIKALLARLGAAEAAVEAAIMHRCIEPECWKCEAIYAWRKSAGKK